MDTQELNNTSSGYDDGYEEGYFQGHEDGHEEGYAEGYEYGYEEGCTEEYEAADVCDCCYGCSDADEDEYIAINKTPITKGDVDKNKRMLCDILELPYHTDGTVIVDAIISSLRQREK